MAARDGGQPNRFTLTNTHHDVVATFGAWDPSVAASAAYTPFGEIAAHTATPPQLGYQSEYTDPDTGRSNMHARWYTPATGTFTSRDTWTLPPDPSIQANRYTYAGADPLSGVDPSGHYCVPSQNPVSVACLADAAKTAGKIYVAGVIIRVAFPVIVAGALVVGDPFARPLYGDCPPSGCTFGGGVDFWRTNTCWGWECTVQPRTPLSPGGGPGGGGGGGGHPLAPSLKQIQAFYAELALRTPAPRPPMTNEVSQSEVDARRDAVERNVKPVEINTDWSTVISSLIALAALESASALLSPIGGGGGRPPTTDTDDPCDDDDQNKDNDGDGCGDSNENASDEGDGPHLALGLSRTSESKAALDEFAASRNAVTWQSSIFKDIWRPRGMVSANPDNVPAMIDRVVQRGGRISFNLRDIRGAREIGAGTRGPRGWTEIELRYVCGNSAARAVTTFYNGPAPC